MTGQPSEVQWYIARDGKQHGPLTEIEMKTFVGHSYLRPTDLLWKPGMTDWQPATQVFPNVFQPPMPSPAPASPSAAPAGGYGAAQAGPASFGAGGTFSPFPSSPVPQGADLSGAASPYENGRGRLLKRVALGAVALTLVGGGAFAVYTLKDPLVRLVSGPKKPAPAAATPEVGAKLAAEAVGGDTKTAALAPDPTAHIPDTIDPALIEGSQLDVRLQKIPAWGLLKKDFPDWYISNVAAAEKLTAEKKPGAEVATQLVQGLVKLRRENADKALAASPEKLKRVAAAFLENLRSLQAQSVGACYGYISKGELSPGVVELMISPENAPSFNNHMLAVFEAVAEGSKSPVKHESAVKADYDILIQELGKLGWKEEDLQTFSNPRLLAKREPGQVCKMVQEWFVAHLAVPDAAAQERLLFETLKPVVSG